MPPKDPDSSSPIGPWSKTNRPRAIRRLVIWYRRNAAVTTLVDSATSSATAAGSMAGNVASSVLQPLVFDPLRRLQGNTEPDEIRDEDRLWVAVDGMGGDHAPGPILDGCLQAIDRLPLKIRFVGETDRIRSASEEMNLSDEVDAAISNGYLDLVASGPSITMNEEATAVRRKRDASINVAMDLVKKGQALAVYSAGNSGAVMASAIFRLGRLKGIDRPAIGALFPTKDPSQPVLVLDVGANMDCKPTYLHQFAPRCSLRRDVLQVSPRIGLLNIGEEECKGNDLALRTHALLTKENGCISPATAKVVMCSPGTSTWSSAMASPATFCSSSSNRWAACCWSSPGRATQRPARQGRLRLPAQQPQTHQEAPGPRRTWRCAAAWRQRHLRDWPLQQQVAVSGERPEDCPLGRQPRCDGGSGRSPGQL